MTELGAHHFRSSDHPVESVLVPLDGSAVAELAVETGAALASGCGACLHLAGIVRADEAKLDLGDGVEVAQPGSREYAAQLDEYVTRLAGLARERFLCPVEPMVITSDDPADGLTDYERRIGVDLTVMAVPTPADPERHALSEAVTRDAPSPVLFVPTSASGAGPRRALPPRWVAPRVIAVIAHTTGRGDTVLECAAKFGRLWGAALRLIDGASLGASPGAAGDADIANGRRARLGSLAEGLRADGLDAEAWAMEGPRAEDALLAAIAEGAVDVVITGHAAKALSERLLFGPSDRHGRAGGERRVGVLLCPS